MYLTDEIFLTLMLFALLMFLLFATEIFLTALWLKHRNENRTEVLSLFEAG